jgi:uncharacterized protein (DUF305 family)
MSQATSDTSSDRHDVESGVEGPEGPDDAGPDDEGPDDEGPDDDDAQVTGRMSRGVLAVVRTLVGILFLLAAGALGFAFANGTPTPTDNSVAAGLARDMIDHHAQAVDMATIVQARTQDATIRTLATDIALTQTNQMGQMQGWLNQWNLSVGRSGPPMAWMTQNGHSMQMGSGSTMDPAWMKLQPNGLMPGMATQEQVNQLRTLPPAQADVLFLKLMIAHHRGGVTMAQVALDETKERVVVSLCRTIVKGQQLEITQMTQLLQQRS